MKEKNIICEASAKKQKPPRATPTAEPALPLLLSAVVFVICFITLIIDKFIVKIGGELLAPVILQLVAFVIPAYLVIMLTASERSTLAQMRGIGFHLLRAEYIFFVLFASLFTICASLILTLSLGGAYDASHGLTLLGTFTAGENDYTVSFPYLILTYAAVPAIAEEFLFRGVIFSRLERIGFPFAAAAATLLYSLSGFTVGGFIPSLFVGIMSIFVLYTAKSLWASVIMHFLFNLYRLFLEANISEYFLSSQNNILLLITVLLALCISALLFFSESARIFRQRAGRIAAGEARSEKKLGGIATLKNDIRSTLAYTPSLVFFMICLCIFAATVVINYFV